MILEQIQKWGVKRLHAFATQQMVGFHEARDVFASCHWVKATEVKDKIPADRLLIYNLTDGWGPLCEFLNKPIPNQDGHAIDVSWHRKKDNHGCILKSASMKRMVIMGNKTI